MRRFVFSFLTLLLIENYSAQRTGNVRKSECEIAREKALKSNIVGKLVPNCEPSGEYSALQCHFSSSFCQCWRTDGTPITQPSRKIKACDCIRLRDEAQKPSTSRNASRNPKAIVEYEPQCNESGRFEKKQCDKSRTCWCVDEKGKQTSRNKVKTALSCP